MLNRNQGVRVILDFGCEKTSLCVIITALFPVCSFCKESLNA